MAGAGLDLAAKAALGAGVVLLVAALSRSSSYYVAGLVPLFPTFGLIAHWMVGSQRSAGDLRRTVVFGALGVVPYLAYLGSVYLLAGRVRLPAALAISTLVWLALAALLVAAWPR